MKLLLALLILSFNAFFAAAEVALISVRESRLRQMTAEGRAGAQAALNLLANPGRLLSVTQLGVTLASLGLGWAGEDALFRVLVSWLGYTPFPISARVLHAVILAVSFLIISYAHVVIGEVVPKNLAIEKADRLALAVAPVLSVFYRVASPFVYVLEQSAAVVSRVLGVRGRRGGGHSAEELKLIVTSSRGLGYLPERTG